MPGNTFGKIFRVSTFGESHGSAIGVSIDGCPAGLELDLDKIKLQMQRRRPGQSSISTPRSEQDEIIWLSGLLGNITTGAPIAAIIHNKDSKPSDYDHLKHSFRPSHADYTYTEKYGIRDVRGGGRSSARETACRVIAGSIAEQLLANDAIEICAWVSSIGKIEAPELQEPTRELVDANIVRCPDPGSAQEMIDLIEQTKSQGDTLGGTISCVIRNCPPGLGEPVFDKLHADLAKAMLSINAVKGFEIGSGFKGTLLKGSEHNDIFIKENDRIKTKTNHSGGIQGGISNGMDIRFKVAFKPVSTIMKEQQSIDSEGNSITLEAKGRHDPCVVPRAVPIVEAMVAIVLADQYLRNRTARL